MRSGRGKCPQCKEMIVVDLDAEELRCPFCNALLKKSAKSVADVRAEEEARIAAAKERETVVEEPTETPATETSVEPVAAEVPAEDVSVEESVAPAETAEEPADEIGITDEELAMMDEVPATEEQSEETVDEIGISDEELAMMDEAPADEQSEATSEDPLVFGSIGADADEETPEEVAEAEDAEAEKPAEEDLSKNKNIEIEDDVDPALLDEDVAALDDAPEAPEETAEETPAAAETPEELSEVPEEPVAADEISEEGVALEETPVEEPTESVAEIAVEDAPAELVVEDAPAEELTLEDPVVDETPAETADAPVEEVAAPAEPEEERYVPTEEDMAFAASLSETGRGYIAPKSDGAKTAVQAERGYKKVSQERSAHGGESIYKKPVAAIMMILSILASVFFFLYYKREAAIGLISTTLLDKLNDILPTFGGDYFNHYVTLIFFGLIVLTSILALTGKKGKLGFLFLLLANLLSIMPTVWNLVSKSDALPAALQEYRIYFEYGVYFLMLLAAVFFAISLATGKHDLAIPGGTVIAPFIFLGVVTLGYLALLLLPKVIDFTVSAALVRYSIFGIWGVAFLLTFVGVHNAAASRGANGWLAFSTLLAIVLVYVIGTVVYLLGKDKGVELQKEIPDLITPIIGLIGLTGFTASDLRN